MLTLHPRAALASAALLLACSSDQPSSTPDAALDRVLVDTTDVTSVDVAPDLTSDAPALDAAVCRSPPSAPDTGLRCESATPLPIGELLGQRLPLTGSPDTTCARSDAPRRFYAFTVPARRRVVVTAGSDSTFTPVLRVRAACDAATCVGTSTASSAYDRASVVVDNDGESTRNMIAEVSGPRAGAVGGYAMVLWQGPLRGGTGPMCSEPSLRALQLPIDSLALPPVGARDAGDDSYRMPLHIEERTGIALEASGCNQLAIYYGCDETTLAASGRDPTPDGGIDSALRAVLAPGDYTVVASVARLDATVRLAAFPPAQNFEISRALGVGDADTAVCSLDPARGGRIFDRCLVRTGSGSYTGNPLYFSATVPPRSVLAARTDRGAVSVFEVDIEGCTDRGGPGVYTSFDWFANNSDAPRELRIVLTGHDRYGFERSMPNLSVSRSPFASNGDCAAPRELVDGQLLTGETSTRGRCSSGPCLPGRTSGTLYYAATLPPGTVLGLSGEARQLSTVDEPRVLLLQRCGEDGEIVPFNRVAVNTTGAPRRVIVGLTNEFLIDELRVSIRAEASDAGDASAPTDR